MSHQVINPDTLYNPVPYGFSHAIKSSAKATIYCAGQVAWDKEYKIVGEDNFGMQMRQALANLRHVLAAAGAGPEHVVRIRTYIVNLTTDKLAVISEEMGRFFGDLPPRPNTLIGVTALALPEFLVEIEATAEV